MNRAEILQPARPAPSGALRAALPGGRLHLQHGPIDLVIGAMGPAEEVESAYDRAAGCFVDVLPTLVAELAVLKRPIGAVAPRVDGPVARRMLQAVWPYRDRFITPMAAVAGTVAEHVLEHMAAGSGLRRAYVNNGGDIALWLRPGESFRLGVVAKLGTPQVDRRVTIDAGDPVRGVATSGWGGRSFSLGIADAVTVFAADAPSADAAATIVGNAVTTDHPGIRRAPANTLQEDTDLGALPVTVGVDLDDRAAIADALDAGVRDAHRLVEAGRIAGALLFLGGQSRIAGWPGAEDSAGQSGYDNATALTTERRR